jgi:DNA polymerase III sliding clamp (beta) subunit (PCNA family)
MLNIILDTKKLKNAMTVISLAAGSTESALESHCLFEIKDNKLLMTGTDKDKRIARACIDATIEGEGMFTADPKKLLSLIKTTSSDTIRLMYFPETTTLEVYSSEDKDSFVSLPSFDPAIYPAVGHTFDEAYPVKTLNAGVLLVGIRFIQDYLLKSKGTNKFSNMFISQGIIYGSNGNDKIGAFTSPDIEGLDELVFPEMMLGPIANLIEKPDLDNITISTTSEFILIGSDDKSFIFGFSKPKVKVPKMPVDIKEPEANGGEIEVGLLLKKFGRLKIAGDVDMGLRISLGDHISISTLLDRASKDTMPCKRIGTEEKDILVKCRVVEGVLDSFSAVPGLSSSTVKMFVARNLSFHWSGDLQMDELSTDNQPSTVVKSIVCVGKVSPVSI